MTTFSRPANTRLDASGYGTCFVTCPSGVRWKITRTSVSTNAPIPVPGSGTVTVQPTVTIYKDNKPNAAAFVEGTGSGNRDTSNTVHILQPGESLCAEWIGNATHANLIATFTVAGEQV